MSVRLFLALFVFLIDLWALNRVFGAGLPWRTRLAWTALVVGLPLLGAWLWWRRERRTLPLSTSASPDLPNVPTH